MTNRQLLSFQVKYLIVEYRLRKVLAKFVMAFTNYALLH